jgi:hypothetical protein
MILNKPEIKNFVREGLGCTCDEEVFESVCVEHKPQSEENLHAGYLLTIGGKLLVYLIMPDAWTLLMDSMEQIFKWGRELRDRGGYNRFRLVVVTSDIESAKENLYQYFSSLPGLDEKLHLHVIEPDKAPLCNQFVDIST